MKRLLKYMFVLLFVVAAAGSTITTYAAPGDGPRRGGLRGEVSAVDASSVTVTTRDDESVVAHVNDETTVFLVATQSEGSLADIEVGDHIQARGSRNDDGSVDASRITVAPDGDKVSGRVTAVDGGTITLENRDGSITVLTDGSTLFWTNREAGSIDDVAVNSRITAYGETEGDGSVSASVVFVSNRGGPRGGR